jgi:hypothetical protein
MFLLIRSIQLKVSSFIFTTQVELHMLKLTSLAIGLLAVISIAPNSEAMTANTQPSLQQPAANLHSQIIFRIGDRGYTRRQEGQYRRDLVMQRKREAQRRQYNNRMGGSNRNGEPNRDSQNRRDR